MAQVALLSRLRSEVAAVLGPPWRALRTNGQRARRTQRTSPAVLAVPRTFLAVARTFPLALTCTAIIGIFALVQHTSTGWWLVEHVAGVYQALPLPLILLRLPLSMFAPAPDLPAWGAMVQVLVVFGFSEIHLGRVRTLVAAICVNGLTTVSARIMVIVGLHLSIGTPQVDQYELDTGPSTVVVALAIYVALARRAYILLAITTAAMAAEVVVLPNLAGREHLVALALGAAAYLIGERVPSHGTRRNTTIALTPTPEPASSPAPPLKPRTPRPMPAATSAGTATAATTAPTATADTPRPHAPDATPQHPASQP